MFKIRQPPITARARLRVWLTTVGAVGVCSAAFAQAASAAAPAFLCVPATAGQAVTSDGNGTTRCAGTGTTQVRLPSSAPDQQTLISILPYLRYKPHGIDGKPTITLIDANLQIVSGSQSTAGPVNGTGNLVIGYDESPGTQTGSHNLVLGAGTDIH